MASKYANKSGNNGNSGNSHAAAWLTLAYAYANAASGDTLYVGSGYWYEGNITLSNKTLTIVADGWVVIDGAGLTRFATHSRTSGGGTDTVTYTGPFTFRNFLTDTIRCLATVNGGSVTGVFTNCHFELCPVGVVIYGTGTSATVLVQFNRCTAAALTQAFVRSETDSSNNPSTRVEFVNCTVYNCLNVVLANTAYLVRVSRVRGNIFSTCTYFVNHGTSAFNKDTQVFSPVVDASDYADNYFYTVAHYYVASGVDNTTFATFIANLGTTKFRYDDAEADPILQDPANGLLGVRPTSPVLGAGQIASYIGAHRANLCASENFNSTGTWTIGSPASGAGTEWGLVSGSVSVNASGNFQGDGVIVSPVWTLASGGTRFLYRFNAVLTEDYPTGVIDYDLDSAPNRKRFEIRYSNSSFNQDAASPSWAVYEFGADLSAIETAYVQIRLTFRTNGTAA